MVPETLPGQIYLEKLPFAFGHPRWYSGKSIRLQCRNILQFLRHVTPTLSIPLKCVGMRWAVTDAHEFCEHRFPLNYLRCTPRMTAPPEEEHSVSSTLCSALTGCHALTPPLHWGRGREGERGYVGNVPGRYSHWNDCDSTVPLLRCLLP